MSADEQRDLKAYFGEHFERLEKKVDGISRGIYGENENDNPGLMKRMKVAEIKLAKVFTFKNRLVWIGVGVAGGVTVLWKVVEVLIS
jgi:hypothetical protein